MERPCRCGFRFTLSRELGLLHRTLKKNSVGKQSAEESRAQFARSSPSERSRGCPLSPLLIHPRCPCRRRSRSSRSTRPGLRTLDIGRSRSSFTSRQDAAGAGLPFVQNRVSWIVVGGAGTSRRRRLMRGSGESRSPDSADFGVGRRRLMRRKNCVLHGFSPHCRHPPVPRPPRPR